MAWVSGPAGWVWTLTPDGYRVAGPAVPVPQDATYVVILAHLPASSPVLFKTIRTYSDGREDAWAETSNDLSIEVDMPPPALDLTGEGAKALPGTRTRRRARITTATTRTPRHPVATAIMPPLRARKR